MNIPEKYFYTIGDVCDITGVKSHILRYWESEFKLLRPARRYSGHRKYTKKDIELIQKIRILIVDRKFTLAGAKREIQKQFSSVTSSKPLQQANINEAIPVLRDIKKDVDACLQLLSEDLQAKLF
ncbi:MAG: MerR family transcriptional regulator [Elusimicrobiota bacterium]